MILQVYEYVLSLQCDIQVNNEQNFHISNRFIYIYKGGSYLVDRELIHIYGTKKSPFPKNYNSILIQGDYNHGTSKMDGKNPIQGWLIQIPNKELLNPSRPMLSASSTARVSSSDLWCLKMQLLFTQVSAWSLTRIDGFVTLTSCRWLQKYLSS